MTNSNNVNEDTYAAELKSNCFAVVGYNSNEVYAIVGDKDTAVQLSSMKIDEVGASILKNLGMI